MAQKSPQKSAAVTAGKTAARPPVVVVMGHVDHGKSTLLDYIRKSNVVAGETGGITQHLGAYQAEHISGDKIKHLITFLDTPGHAAFLSIRESGAKAADVAILVVSAEDGVKPQTLEALKAIQAAKLPYVVAISKTDKPNANINKTKESLGENEIYVEGWGGDIPCVGISGVTGAGVPELLDMVLLVAGLADLKADASAPASGIVIESKRDARSGISATLIIKNGTLTTGCFVVSGICFAPVRYIEDFKETKIASGGPSMPVNIVGWNESPVSGMAFVTVGTKKEAESMVAEYKNKKQDDMKKAAAAAVPAKKIEIGEKAVAADKKLAGSEKGPAIVTLPFVIKADADGSLEGIKHELAKITHEKVILKIVSEGIGEINENDVKLALGDPNIVILGLHVTPDKKAATYIERSPVTVKTFSLIYELVQFVQERLTTNIPKEFVEETTGRAKILALFSKEKDKQVVGGKVETGTIVTGNDVKILRRENEIGRGKIRELQEKKQRTTEVAEGHEFGVMVEAKFEIAIGDRIECVRTVEKI